MTRGLSILFVAIAFSALAAEQATPSSRQEAAQSAVWSAVMWNDANVTLVLRSCDTSNWKCARHTFEEPHSLPTRTVLRLLPVQ